MSTKKWWTINDGKRPTGDYMCKANISGQKGLILVKVKAHVSETLRAKRKLIKDANTKQEGNHKNIESCISNELNKLNGEYSGYYQIANRIAYDLHAEEVLNIPIILVFLGFIRDNHFKDFYSTSGSFREHTEECLENLKCESLIDNRKDKMTIKTVVSSVYAKI